MGKDTEDKEEKNSWEEKAKELRKELEEEKELAQKYYKALQRVQADLENYQKRAKREKENFVKYANERLITSLLEVLDNFERALNSAQESKDKDSLMEGLQMIRKQLWSVLEKEGLTPIKAEGECFDPEKHEAVMAVECEENEGNTIVEELQKGYKLRGKVIRPSKVKISKSSSKENKPGGK